MSKGNIAIIGDRDSVLLFRAIGLSVYPESDALEASKCIARLAREGCKVIFVTEPLFVACAETIDKYRAEAYPAIIPIPDGSGASGVALANLKANVEKAIGADILFSEDE
ncbi:MAG: V-type ATP synthase subunit F [Clostridia bacterium]|nr:V-type ATP synthase subunit F [Clostridia bacterium]